MEKSPKSPDIPNKPSRLRRKLAAAGLALITAMGLLDVAVAFAEPERPHVATIHNPEMCDDARFDAVHLSSTGRDIAGKLAHLNKEIIEQHQGVVISIKYGTRYNPKELAEVINLAIEQCRDSQVDPADRPLVLAGASLGGRVAQELVNSGKLNSEVVAIIQEATPTDSSDILDSTSRLLVDLVGPLGYPIPKGITWFELAKTHLDRQVNPLSGEARGLIRESLEETSSKTLGWQGGLLSRPYPASQPDSPPILYIHSGGDRVVDVRAAMHRLKSLGYEVTPISTEAVSGFHLNHAEGWIDILREEQGYDRAYVIAFILSRSK